MLVASTPLGIHLNLSLRPFVEHGLDHSPYRPKRRGSVDDAGVKQCFRVVV